MKSEKYAQYYSTRSINAVNVGGPNGLVLKNFIIVNKQNNKKRYKHCQNKLKTFPYFQFLSWAPSYLHSTTDWNVKWKISEFVSSVF